MAYQSAGTRNSLFFVLMISVFFPKALFADEASLLSSEPELKSQASKTLSKEQIIKISAALNDKVVEAMRVVWHGENLAIWRRAFYQTGCLGSVPGITEFSVYQQGEVLFQQAIKQFVKDVNIPEAHTQTVLFKDMAYAYYHAFVLTYTFAVQSSLRSLQEDFPIQFKDICYNVSLEIIETPEAFTRSPFQYHADNDLSHLPGPVRQQYELIARLGKASHLVFFRSTIPRFNLLMNASMARMFAEHEDFKRVERVYLTSAPLFGEEGFIDAFKQIEQVYDYAAESAVVDDDWRLFNHFWDMQRRAFYLGIGSVIKRLKTSYPDAYLEVKEQVLAGVQYLNLK